MRIPGDIERAIDFASRREKKNEKSQSLRKLAKMGFEVYAAEAYRGGRLTVREFCALTGTAASEALDLLARLGVRGNTGVDEVLSSLLALPPLADRK